ncbi:MAG: hypothetical protein ACRDQX_01130 [Pseudonocardiaceae bacterium]
MSEQAEMVYLETLHDPVPDWRVLVHNDAPPGRRLGHRGFRAWHQERAAGLSVCGCGWAPELGLHFRARRTDG